MSEVQNPCENGMMKVKIKTYCGGKEQRSKSQRWENSMEMKGAGSEDSIRLEQNVWEVTACKFFAGQYFEGWGVWECS